MTPEEAIKKYADCIFSSETKEMEDYEKIYYVGNNMIHRSPECPTGVDDENGRYVVMMHDHIAFRFELLDCIGSGSFGQVFKAFDHKEHETIAIKVIRSERKFFKQAQEEIAILMTLNKMDANKSASIIQLKEHFIFRNHQCLTFELLDLNLYELVKKTNYNGFSLRVVRSFAYSLLNCLRLLNKAQIIHCDLKPENILLKKRGNSGIKVIDFGSSCFLYKKLYWYIQSRFYRAPEVILGGNYTMAIDMWSLGCILAELHTGKALFPGEDECDQLALQMELLGIPPKCLLDSCTRCDKFFHANGIPKYCTAMASNVEMLYGGGGVAAEGNGTNILHLRGGISRKGRFRGPPGSKVLKMELKNCNDDYFIDFVGQCLNWIPEERLTPSKAFSHPWISKIIEA